MFSTLVSPAVVRAVLALLVVGTAMFLYAVQAVIPEGLQTIVGVVLTFFFLAQQNDANASALKTSSDANASALKSLASTAVVPKDK